MIDSFIPLSGESLNWDAIDTAFPWISAMRGSTQDPIYHAEGDVWTHTRMVTDELLALPEYQNASQEDKRILFATALLHDVAKPVTRREEDGRISNRGHSRIGAVMAREILWRMGYPFHLREKICTLIAFHQVPFWLIEKPEWQMHRIVAEVSLSADNRLLGIFAEADARGRVCHDKQTLIDNIELFREISRDVGCYDIPYAFHSDYARIRYFGNPETKKLGDAPFDVTNDDFRAIIMSGLPGCGKSTWVSKQNLPVVSLDDIRRKMKISPRDSQGIVIHTARENAREYLRAKQSFVWDATNLSRDIRELVLNLAHAYNAKSIITYVETSPAEMFSKNQSREHVVPMAAINKMLRKWEVPTLSEAHKINYEVR